MAMAFNRTRYTLNWVIGGCVVLCLIVAWRQTTDTESYKYVAQMMEYTNKLRGRLGAEEQCEQKTSCRLHSLRQRVEQVCRHDHKVRHDGPSYVGNGYRDDKHNLLYFSIPKVGCSFWKRIFIVLHSENGQFNLFDIPSYNAHSGRGLKDFTVKATDVNLLLPNYTSFMFVRDPFSRLFSGYVDKMFLPNPLAQGHGRTFFRRYGDTSAEQRCNMNIPFPNFARYVAELILEKRMGDGHFFPMWNHLNPCDVNLTYIGKMENFMDDTKHILSSVGIDLQDVAGSEKDHNLDEKNEKGIMQDLAARTYKFLKFAQTCLTQKQIIQRIWSTYYIRGFLSKDQPLPHFKKFQNVSLEQLVAAAWKAYDRSAPKSVRFLQRHEAMMEAYSQVPRWILRKLADAFDMDCRVFDYNCNISRFPAKKNIKKFYFKS